jgi:hypothetical protein
VSSPVDGSECVFWLSKLISDEPNPVDQRAGMEVVCLAMRKNALKPFQPTQNRSELIKIAPDDSNPPTS